MMTESDVAKIVEHEIERAGSVRALGREWGVSPCMISDLRNGRRGPGPKVLRQLGMKKIHRIEFVKASAPSR
jgi:predicted transcriptional regulator